MDNFKCFESFEKDGRFSMKKIINPLKAKLKLL